MSPRTQLDEAGLDRVFAALRSRTRREILDVVAQTPGSTVGFVADHFDISRIAILKHLTTLEDAGLLISVRRGRERLLQMRTIDGRKPKLATRFMYALFARLGFVLPQRTRAEHWPLPTEQRR